MPDPVLLGGAAMVALLAGLSYLVYIGDGISVPFVLSLAAVIGLLAEFVVPGFILDRLPIPPAVAGLDAVTFALIAAIVIFTWWVIEARFVRGRKRPETVAKRVRKNAENLAEAYLTMGRLAFAFGFSLVFIFANQLAQLAGELGTMIGNSPLEATNLFAIGLSYLSLGGSLPVIGSLGFTVSAELVAVVLLATFSLGIMVKYR